MQATAESSRTWLGPFTGVAFSVIGMTGVLMFFHVGLPGMSVVHELGGLLFVIAAVWHVKLNWRHLVRCCGQRKGRISIVAGVLLMMLLAGFGLAHDQHHRGERHGQLCRDGDLYGSAGRGGSSSSQKEMLRK